MKNISTSRHAFKKYFLFPRSILFFMAFALFAKNDALSQSVAIVIDPPVSIVQVNQNFTVDVKVDFGTGTLSAVDAYVNFNNLDLAVVSTTVPSATQTALPGISVNFTSVANMNTLGQVDHGRFTSAPIGSHPNDDFVLFSITFQALRVPPGGTTAISFNVIPARQTLAVEGFSPILSGTTPGSVSISAIGCTPPSATISAAPTCDANAFNLTLLSATGTAPYDLTIASPAGTATYNDIPVSGVITNFNPPTSRVFPAVPGPLPATFDDAAYTLGVRFSSSVTGFVRGVRFLSAGSVSAAPGNYTGQLWTNAGVLLASGTFVNVTADGWQEILFAEPILISAATPYVASYNLGASISYASTPNGLTAPVTTGPITALANGGLYIPGGVAAFPTTSTNNNYWADVIFSANNYAFNLTGVKDALECTSNGALQTLNVTSIDCSTLPVSLVSFSATPKDNAVLLRWSTASEFNNLGFEVQRSIDGGNNGWSAIGFVNGAGNSSSTLNYSLVDENLAATRYYYRLKQIDIDQHFAYSAIVSVDFNAAKAFSLQQNFPNPFRGETTIRFTLPQKTTINLSIFDMNGRLVRVLASGTKESGTHAVTLNSGILTGGLYYYKLQAGDFSAVKKFTVQ